MSTDSETSGSEGPFEEIPLDPESLPDPTPLPSPESLPPPSDEEDEAPLEIPDPSATAEPMVIVGAGGAEDAPHVPPPRFDKSTRSTNMGGSTTRRRASAADRIRVTTSPTRRRIKAFFFFSIPLATLILIVGGFFFEVTVLKRQDGTEVRKLFWLAAWDMAKDALGIGKGAPSAPTEVAPAPSPSAPVEDPRLAPARSVIAKIRVYVEDLPNREATWESLGLEKLDQILADLKEYRGNLSEYLEGGYLPDDEQKAAQNLNNMIRNIVPTWQGYQEQMDRKLHPEKYAKPPTTPPPPTPQPTIPPPVTPDPVPEVPPTTARLLPDSWSGFPVGSWAQYDLQIQQESGSVAATMNYTLKEIRENDCMVTLEQKMGEVPATSNETPFARNPRQVELVRTETLTVGEATFRCQVQSFQRGGLPTTAWILDEGEFAGRIELKSESRLAGNVLSVTRVLSFRSEKASVQGRELDCIYFESESGQSDAIPVRSQTWWSDQVPGHIVKMVTPALTQVLVGFGTELASKPAIPEAAPAAPTAPPPPAPNPSIPSDPEPAPPVAPPEPVEDPAVARRKRAEFLVQKGDDAVKIALPLYKEIVSQMSALPPDKEQRQALLTKIEKAESSLRSSVDSYREARPDLENPADTDRKIEKIESLLKKLADYSQKVRSGL